MAWMGMGRMGTAIGEVRARWQPAGREGALSAVHGVLLTSLARQAIDDHVAIVMLVDIWTE